MKTYEYLVRLSLYLYFDYVILYLQSLLTEPVQMSYEARCGVAQYVVHINLIVTPLTTCCLDCLIRLHPSCAELIRYIVVYGSTVGALSYAQVITLVLLSA